MSEFKLLIDNSECQASDGRTFLRRSPLSGETASRAAAATVQDAIRAVESSAAAFPSWSALGPSARRAILNRAADLFEARAESFMKIMTAETGAAPSWALFNARLASGMLREAAAMTTHIKGELLPSDKPRYVSMIQRVPAGVCLAIAPWNAPLILCARAIGMPLACGNTVVLKTSELSPGTQVLIGKLMHEAGLPPGVLNVLTVDPADNPVVVEAIIAHPKTRRVNFTGSTRVGRIIGEMAGRHLKPALLELGGKAPFLVLEDADLDEAVSAAAFGAFVHQGQVCMSTERVIVDRTIADEFAKRLAAKAATLASGDTRTSNAPIGSLVDQSAVGRLQELLRDAVAKGAKVLAGGTVTGTVMEATVLDHVSAEMKIYAEESFGPVVAIVRVEGFAEAVRVANDTEYGLSAAIFSRDVTRALDIARNINVGACHINGPTVQDEAFVPLGGVKASGYGRFAGLPGIEAFTEVKWITIENHSNHYPF